MAEGFGETAKAFDALHRTAQGFEQAANVFPQEAIGLAIIEARATLRDNLIEAIDKTPEFQNELLKASLIVYFTDPARIQFSNGEIVVATEQPEAAREQWLAAQQIANEMRREATGAKQASERQAYNYWRFAVYRQEDYEETIKDRFAVLGGKEIAPYWYFLEYGTGISAYPQSKGQYFLAKTQSAVGGTQLLKYYEELLARDFERAMVQELENSITTISVQYIRWSRWYAGKGGKLYSHVYDSRTGYKVAGYKARIKEAL